MCSNHEMPSPTTDLYKKHRFPPEIIGHAVWLVLSSYGREYNKLRLKWEGNRAHKCFFYP